MAIRFNTKIKQFNTSKGIAGWTYIELTPAQVQKLKPGTRLTFRVKGTLDDVSIEKLSILPMGTGAFILTINAKLRKILGKKKDDTLRVSLEVDDRKIPLSKDLLECLKDDPDANAFFKTLTQSNKQYFSTWIESAKTTQTKTRRIVEALTALSSKQTYGDMLAARKREAL